MLERLELHSTSDCFQEANKEKSAECHTQILELKKKINPNLCF